MRKLSVALAAASIVACVGAGSALSARSGKDGGAGDFAIYVAPGTIAKSAACNWVTIHTDVSYHSVAGDAAAVNGTEVEVAVTFADDRGNLVAKLRFTDVVALVDPPSATITLTLTVVVDEDEMEERSASETVRVRD